MGTTPERTADIIVRLGNPPAAGMPLAWYLIVGHVAGGLLLIIGLWLLVLAATLTIVLAGPGAPSVDAVREQNRLPLR
jgi:hypothetical protein